MNLRILQEASAELADAIAHYEGIEAGLGIRLKEEVRAALSWIEENPELPRIRSNGYRRINLKVFAYYLAYTIWEDAIWVLAIAHSARRPEYWIDRSSGRD